MAVTWPSAVTTEYDADDGALVTSNAQALRDRGEVLRETPMQIIFNSSTSHTEPFEVLSSHLGGTLHGVFSNNGAVAGSVRLIIQDNTGSDLVVGSTVAHVGGDAYVECSVALTKSLILPFVFDFGHSSLSRVILEFERVSGTGNYSGAGLNAWIES